MSNRVRNARGRFAATKPIDVRTESQVPALESMIATGPITFVLVYADWCGHCQGYKPTWKSFEKTPGRTANIASIHHDMMDKVPAIANAKIEGYPSVIKVQPTGKIEEYKVPGTKETTNALPEMRDEARMKEELTAEVPAMPAATAATGNVAATAATAAMNLRLKNTLPKSTTAEGLPKTIPVSSVIESAPNAVAAAPNAVATPVNLRLKNTLPKSITAEGLPKTIPVSSVIESAPAAPADSGMPGYQGMMHSDADYTYKNVQSGGALESVMSTFLGALQQAGPAALLLLAHSALSKPRSSKHGITYKSPKRASRRASTRKNRR